MIFKVREFRFLSILFQQFSSERCKFLCHGWRGNTGKFQNKMPKLQIIFTNQSRELQKRYSPYITKLSCYFAIWEKARKKLLWFYMSLIFLVCPLLCLLLLCFGVCLFLRVSSKHTVYILSWKIVLSSVSVFLCTSCRRTVFYNSRNLSLFHFSFLFLFFLFRLTDTYSRSIFALSSNAIMKASEQLFFSRLTWSLPCVSPCCRSRPNEKGWKPSGQYLLSSWETSILTALHLPQPCVHVHSLQLWFFWGDCGMIL